jgi:multidrug resistance efflux pump
MDPRMTALSQRTGRIAVTLVLVALACIVGWRLWVYYMVDPWTRDARVRAEIIGVAPDVSGLVSQVMVRDNEPVHRGEVLFTIDRARFQLALDQAEAQLAAAGASVQTTDAQIIVQQAQVGQSEAQLEQAQAALVFAQQQAARFRTLAVSGAGSVQNAQQYSSQLDQQQAALKTAEAGLAATQQQVVTLRAQRETAEANLEQAKAQRDVAALNLTRSEIRSPVDGVITNLELEPGDYVSVGSAVMALVDSATLHVDGYFEETKLAHIHPGDPVLIRLMGESRVVHGHVESVAGAIADRDRTDGLLANVNPTFDWVRLAQRIPVRIAIDSVPQGLRLIPGRTATVAVGADVPQLFVAPRG